MSYFSLKIFMLCLIGAVLSAYALAQAPDNIAFCIADVKYDGKNLKILEFGDCAESMFSGYNALYGKGAMWSLFWKHLAQFKLPLWYVGSSKNSMGLSTLKKLGGTCVASMTALHSKIKEEAKAFRKTGAKDSSGIVFVKSSYTKAGMRLLKKNFPSLIFVNNKVRHHVRNKCNTEFLFRGDSFLKAFRPACKVCSKKCPPGLSESIIHELKSDTYVIKPTDGSCGRGIVFVPKKELNAMLESLFKDRSALLNMKQKNSHTFGFWTMDRSTHFLVEEYVPSKILTIAGKPYDPTMRLVFTMSSIGDNINITILGAYWKLPAKSLIEKSTLTERHRSDVHSSAPVNSVKVDHNDFEHVSQMFTPVMEKIYKRILKRAYRG